jgi:hypothetical protein
VIATHHKGFWSAANRYYTRVDWVGLARVEFVDSDGHRQTGADSDVVSIRGMALAAGNQYLASLTDDSRWRCYHSNAEWPSILITALDSNRAAADGISA